MRFKRTVIGGVLLLALALFGWSVSHDIQRTDELHAKLALGERYTKHCNAERMLLRDALRDLTVHPNVDALSIGVGTYRQLARSDWREARLCMSETADWQVGCGELDAACIRTELVRALTWMDVQ